MIILTTQRLELRQLTTADAAFMLQLLNSPGWLRYIGDRGIRTEAAAEQYLLNGPIKSYEQHGFGLWMVQVQNGAHVGICGLIRRDGLDDIDIGFAMLPEYAGMGYASESAAAVLDFARNEPSIRKVVAITSKDNDSSVNVLRKIGLSSMGTVTLPGDTEELLLFGIDL